MSIRVFYDTDPIRDREVSIQDAFGANTVKYRYDLYLLKHGERNGGTLVKSGIDPYSFKTQRELSELSTATVQVRIKDGKLYTNDDTLWYNDTGGWTLFNPKWLFGIKDGKLFQFYREYLYNKLTTATIYTDTTCIDAVQGASGNSYIVIDSEHKATYVTTTLSTRHGVSNIEKLPITTTAGTRLTGPFSTLFGNSDYDRTIQDFHIENYIVIDANKYLWAGSPTSAANLTVKSLSVSKYASAVVDAEFIWARTEDGKIEEFEITGINISNYLPYYSDGRSTGIDSSFAVLPLQGDYESSDPGCLVIKKELVDK